MHLMQPQQARCGKFRSYRSSCARKSNMGKATSSATDYNWSYDNHAYSRKFGASNYGYHDFSQNYSSDELRFDLRWPEVVPSSKRRKTSTLSCENTRILYHHQDQCQNDFVNSSVIGKPLKYSTAYNDAQLACSGSAAALEARYDDSISYGSSTSKHDHSKYEDDEVFFMSRDEIEKCSPSRRDGIDQLQEMLLRYSYCSFLQNLGIRLDIPQTTIGTAIVLCHRFFVRRSHASHDRFLIATAVLFLASKSEETSRPLNDVLRASCEVLHEQDFSLLLYTLPIGWFEQYRERILEAEQLVLRTLNFELNVQHPYESLVSTLQKLGLSQSVLVNVALNLVSEGVCSGLACTHYHINTWSLMCCSSNVMFVI